MRQCPTPLAVPVFGNVPMSREVFQEPCEHSCVERVPQHLCSGGVVGPCLGVVPWTSHKDLQIYRREHYEKNQVKLRAYQETNRKPFPICGRKGYPQHKQLHVSKLKLCNSVGEMRAKLPEMKAFLTEIRVKLHDLGLP